MAKKKKKKSDSAGASAPAKPTEASAAEKAWLTGNYALLQKLAADDKDAAVVADRTVTDKNLFLLGAAAVAVVILAAVITLT